MAEIRITPKLPTPATLDPSGFDPVAPAAGPLSAPILMSEEQLNKKIRGMQTKMGIPTDQEYDPLAPGATDQELWPAQPGGQWIDFRLT